MEFILRIGLLFFFVIWSRVGHVSSAIAGIDLGSHTIKVSHRSQATSVIDIIPNSQGDRYRPSILLYKDGDFLLETLALNELLRYPMSSYIGLSRLIGLRYDDESALRYRQIYPSDMKRGPDGSGIIFNPPGSGEPFTLEELISLQLDNSVSECDGINYPNQALNAVISVPDSYGYREKMVLKTAASLAKKIRLSGIVSHSESVAAYVSGTSKFKKNEKYLIFNSGHLHLCVSAFEVSLTEGYDTEEKVQNSPISITMLASSCTEKFGMENIDLQLLNVVKADLISKNGSMEKDLNDTGHPTYLKLLQKVSKSKHDLSGADLAIMKIDGSSSGLNDIEYHLSKKSLEDIISRDGHVINELIEDCLKKAKIPEGELNCVVFVGGGSAIESIRKMATGKIASHTPNIKDCHMINSRDVVALGSGRLSAMRSKIFRLKKMEFSYKYHEDVYIRHNASKAPETIPFFDGSTYKQGYSKTLTINAHSDFDIDVYAIDNKSKSEVIIFRKNIRGFDSIPGYDKNSPDNNNYEVTLSFSLSDSDLITLSSEVVAHPISSSSTEPKSDDNNDDSTHKKTADILFSKEYGASNSGAAALVSPRKLFGNVPSNNDKAEDDAIDNVVAHVEREDQMKSSPPQFVVLSTRDSDQYPGYSIDKGMFLGSQKKIEKIYEKREERMKAQEKLYDLHELCLNIVNRSDDFETLLGEFLDQEENDTINETAKAALALINNADAEDPDPLLIDNYAKKLQEMISTSKVRRKTIKNINSMVEEAGGLQTSGKHGTGSNLTLADIYKIAKLKASEKGEEKKGEFDVLLKEYNELLSNYLVHTGKTEEKKASGPAGPPATTPEQSIDHEASTTADTDGVSAITDPKGVTTDENPAVYNNTASGDDTVPEEGVEGVAPSLNETSIPPISADKVSKIPEEYPALDNKSGSSALPQVDEASLSKDNDHDTQADKHKHENSNAASPIDELAGEDI